MANNYLITYDLNKQGQDYSDLIAAIKSFSKCAHVQGSVWYVKSTLNTAQVRDFLKQHIDGNDSLLVTHVREIALTGVDDDVVDYILRNWNI